MHRISTHLKMRVLDAIEFAPGRTIRDRIRYVSQQSFEDENGRSYRFTWRTIETWRVRHNKHGVTNLLPQPRSDKGKLRKVCPEALLEAIERVKPMLRDPAALPRGTRISKALIYRLCIEHGFLQREDVAPNTFSRMVNQFELLKPESEVQNKQRLAFSKQFANQMWQGDTMHGPPVRHGAALGSSKTYLIAFIDDASRVVTHGEFFLAENSETFLHALRLAIYKRGLPEQLYFDNGSIYSSGEVSLLCVRSEPVGISQGAARRDIWDGGRGGSERSDAATS